MQGGRESEKETDRYLKCSTIKVRDREVERDQEGEIRRKR